MYNTGHIEYLMQAVKQARKARAAFLEYCAAEYGKYCEDCPLEDMCDWDGHIDMCDERITAELLDAYVEYYNAKENEADRKTLYEATGIDAGWYDFNDDRREI